MQSGLGVTILRDPRQRKLTFATKGNFFVVDNAST